MSLMNEKMASFCPLLDADSWQPVDSLCLIEIEMTGEVKALLDSPLLIPSDIIVKRLLIKLRQGKLLSWGHRFQTFINDDNVKLGATVYFNNNDGDIVKHPTENRFFKLVEACDVLGYQK